MDSDKHPSVFLVQEKVWQRRVHTGCDPSAAAVPFDGPSAALVSYVMGMASCHKYPGGFLRQRQQRAVVRVPIL